MCGNDCRYLWRKDEAENTTENAAEETKEESRVPARSRIVEVNTDDIEESPVINRKIQYNRESSAGGRTPKNNGSNTSKLVILIVIVILVVAALAGGAIGVINCSRSVDEAKDTLGIDSTDIEDIAEGITAISKETEENTDSPAVSQTTEQSSETAAPETTTEETSEETTTSAETTTETTAASADGIQLASMIRSKLPIVAYPAPLSGASEIYAYTDEKLTTRESSYYIDSFSESVVIVGISSDAKAVQVTYVSTTSGTGYRTKWFSAEDILGLNSISISTYRASSDMTTYKMSGSKSTESVGYIAASDDECDRLGMRTIGGTSYEATIYNIDSTEVNGVTCRWKLAFVKR